MTIQIDWANNIAQISSSCRMTDEEVKECLSVLYHAQEIYDNLGSETPERIILLNKNGIVLHTIITRGGKPCTVEVSPNSLFTAKNIIISVIITGLVASFTYYYCY